MTTILMTALIIFGLAAYYTMPVSELPNVDFPTVSVSADLPGADPQTMAAAVATPLERQFSAIPGVSSMDSVSSTGSTNITLQFDLDRNIRDNSNLFSRLSIHSVLFLYFTWSCKYH